MKKRKFILGAMMGAFAISGCGDQPIFDMLAGSNVKVVLKGSYESNDPRPWLAYTDLLNDDTIAIVPPNYALAYNNNSTSDHYLDPSAYSSLPTVFNIDIAEMKINRDDFAPFRCVYKCAINEGSSSDSEPFFNGTGMVFKSGNIISNKQYDTLQNYLRKVVMDNAQKFNTASGNFEGNLETIFYEKTVNGYDVNPYQCVAIYDTLREEFESTNRVFPLDVPISGGLVFDGSSNLVIEARMVFKNYIRRYERLYVAGDTYNSYHFWGMSDWSREVRANDSYIGGNVLSVARSYVEGKTATISGTVPSGSYVIAIPAGDLIGSYIIDDGIPRPDDNYIAIAPRTPGADIDSLLDYYVSNQKHMDFYASYVTNVNKDDTDLTSYHNAWTDHETSRTNLKIPPLATWAGGSTYQLTNVPPGTYQLFYSTSDVPAGSLPKTFSAGVVVTVLESQIGSTISQNL